MYNAFFGKLLDTSRNLGEFCAYRLLQMDVATYTSGEHRWESNITFSVAHGNKTVPPLVLFYLTTEA